MFVARKVAVAGAVACMFAVVPAAVDAQAPPTTTETRATTEEVEVQRPLVTVDTEELTTDDDDDDDNTGLWGLLGLLGLAGLIGLARRKREEPYPTTSGTRVQADVTPRGSTTTKDT